MNKRDPVSDAWNNGENRYRQLVLGQPPLPGYPFIVATMNCARCGDPQEWHRLDDSTNLDPTDPATPFRCIGYDCEASGPPPIGGRACDCPDFAAPTEERTND